MPVAGAGTLTVMVAVGVAQVGAVVAEAVGAERVPAGAATATGVCADVQPPFL